MEVLQALYGILNQLDKVKEILCVFVCLLVCFSVADWSVIVKEKNQSNK